MSVAQYRNRLPQWVSPLKLAAQDTLLEGVVPAEPMLRLAEAVVSVDRSIVASLHFFRDQSGFQVVEGELNAEVGLLCQRCMESMRYEISTNLTWIILSDEAKVGSIPKRYEPWILEDTEADLYSIVEEELLLELPIVSFHETSQCDGDSSYSTGKVEVSSKPNPFEVLQGLTFKK